MIRIGIVGCGSHADRSHIQLLPSIEEVEIGALCDATASTLRSFEERGFTCLLTTSYEELLERVDAVLIATPDRLHLPQLEQAVAAGRHVLCEKPLCEEVKDIPRLKRVLAQATEKELIVSSCHPRRFDPPYTYLHDELPRLTDQLGAVRELLLYFSYHAPTKQGLHKSLLLDHFNHEIDLVSYLFGPSSFTARRLEESEISYTAAGSRPDGLSFYFSGSRALTRRTYSEWIEVRFETGHIEIDLERGQLCVFDHNAKDSPRIRPWPKTNYDLRFDGINRNFIEAISGRASSYLANADLITNSASSAYLHEMGSYIS